MDYPILAAQNGWYKSTAARSTITEIHFIDTAVTTYDETWNCDVDNTGTIKGYRVGTIIYISGLGSGKIAANADSSYMFSKSSDLFSKLTKIVNAGYLDTTNATTMRSMFDRASSLKEIDVSTWNTANVTSFRAMFQGCISIEYLDLSTWNTANVTDMKSMFYSMASLGEMKLKSLGDTSNWNTAKVTDMSRMFTLCSSLETIKVASWDTGSVTDFSSMFNGCASLSTLDVSRWDTHSATTFATMFAKCYSLRKLAVDNWDTVNVTDMYGMFAYCTSLDDLDVSKWDTGKVTTMSLAFGRCAALTELDVSNWTTSNVISFSQMFAACTSLIKITGLNKWDTSASKSFHLMFGGCSSLKKLDLSSFNTRAADDDWMGETTSEIGGIHYMFANVNNVENAHLYNLREIKFGPNFSFNGNGSCEAAVLPTPNAEYIEGADGYWYNEQGQHFIPEEVPSEVAATYYAYFPSPIVEVSYAAMCQLANNVRTYNNSETRYSLDEIIDVINQIAASNGVVSETWLWNFRDGTSIEDKVSTKINK